MQLEELILEWMQKAEQDIKAARFLLDMRPRIIGKLILDRKRETTVRRGMLSRSPRYSRFAVYQWCTNRLLNYARAEFGQIRALRNRLSRKTGLRLSRGVTEEIFS